MRNSHMTAAVVRCLLFKARELNSDNPEYTTTYAQAIRYYSRKCGVCFRSASEEVAKMINAMSFI